MGQYFEFVNLTKKERLDGHALGVGIKLWEWCANSESRILAWLLAKGPNDGALTTKRMKQAENEYRTTHTDKRKEEIIKVVSQEASKPLGLDDFKTCGRWAGDEIVLIGDYDHSGLYDEAMKFTDITYEVVQEFNAFIEDEGLKFPNRRETK